MIIRCENNEECDKIINEAALKMGNEYEISKPEKRNPRFKILKVWNPDDVDEKLIDDIKRRNRFLADDQIEIIKREQVKQKSKNIENCFNIVIQCNGETFKKVMKEGAGKLSVKWKSYKVVDNIYIRRCYKCFGFNHDAKECKAELACSRCSQPHLSNQCKSKIEKCINCVATNKRFSTKLNVNHSVWSNECQVYRKKLEASKRAINYVE